MAVSSLWAGTGDQTSGLGTDWTGVSYWTGANDGYYESCTISTLWDSGMSEYFYAYNYGFSIPSTATITKITVDCYCYGSGSVFCNDGHLLHTDRTPKGDGTPSVSQWPYPAGVVAWTGMSTDLWGVSWTPAQINDSDFGFYSGIYTTLPAGGTGYFDAARINVTYTVPGYGNNVCGVTAANISAIFGVARANVSKVFGA